MKTRHGVIWICSAHALLVPYAGGHLGLPEWAQVGCAAAGFLGFAWVAWVAWRAWATAREQEDEAAAARAEFEERRLQMLTRLQRRANDVPVMEGRGQPKSGVAESHARREVLRRTFSLSEAEAGMELAKERMADRLREMGLADSRGMVEGFAERCADGMHVMDSYGMMDVRDAELRALASEWGTAARRVQMLETGNLLRWERTGMGWERTGEGVEA